MNVCLGILYLSCCFSAPVHQYDGDACPSPLYCRGQLLDHIQRSGLFLDSKQFVDMPTRHPPEQVLAAFSRIPADASREALDTFVHDNFHRAGYELRVTIPRDWQERPAFTEAISDNRLQGFGRIIHAKWRSLTRLFNTQRLCDGCVASSLRLPRPFIIPGGRFREFYYWDTFWILEGLYVSGMCSTARGTIDNMLAIIREFGFVPNGSRLYYVNRSQPPLLAHMLEKFLLSCGTQASFLKDALPLLDLEYQFWMKDRVVKLKDAQGVEHTFNVYGAGMAGPRPESYREDAVLGDVIGDPEKRTRFYRNMAAGAESGWDFSSRWMIDNHDLTSIETCQIIPVDLNAIMFKTETLLSQFHRQLNHWAQAEKYSQAAQARLRAIDSFLWHEGIGRWRDYHLGRKGPMSASFYASDLAPLWFGAYDGKKISWDMVERMLLKQRETLLDQPGGIPASDVVSGQQWDFPNVWAPLQYMMMRLYDRLGDVPGKGHWKGHALSLAHKWLTTTYCGHENHGYLFEKYHAQLVGQPGGGGEYIVQEGFGWTNGVVLWTLKRYGSRLKLPKSCPEYPGFGERHVKPIAITLS